MRIQKVTINNFRCFSHLEINFDPQVNILVGNNGSGKSAILDAIMGGLFPFIYRLHLNAGNHHRMPVSPIRVRDLVVSSDPSSVKEPISISMTLFDEGTSKTKNPIKYSATYPPRLDKNPRSSLDVEQASFTQNNDFLNSIEKISNETVRDSSIKIPTIAYYREDRGFLENESEGNRLGSSGRIESLNDALNASASFSECVKWFFVRSFQELSELKNRGDINFELPDLKRIREAISVIVNPDAKIFFSSYAPDAPLVVSWKLDTGEDRELLLNQLSRGYRNMLALVMDFARRLAQANPQMENPLEAEAILVIDELDLHLHPKWQQTIVPDLRRVFPNTQIIATTHSPEILTTVYQHQIQILEDYQLKACPSPTRGMKSSDVIRSVMGLESLRPNTEEARILQRLFEAIDTDDLTTAKQLRQELHAWNSFDSDLARADLQMRRLERRAMM